MYSIKNKLLVIILLITLCCCTGLETATFQNDYIEIEESTFNINSKNITKWYINGHTINNIKLQRKFELKDWKALKNHESKQYFIVEEKRKKYIIKHSDIYYKGEIWVVYYIDIQNPLLFIQIDGENPNGIFYLLDDKKMVGILKKIIQNKSFVINKLHSVKSIKFIPPTVQ